MGRTVKELKDWLNQFPDGWEVWVESMAQDHIYAVEVLSPSDQSFRFYVKLPIDDKVESKP